MDSSGKKNEGRPESNIHFQTTTSKLIFYLIDLSTNTRKVEENWKCIWEDQEKVF